MCMMLYHLGSAQLHETNLEYVSNHSWNRNQPFETTDHFQQNPYLSKTKQTLPIQKRFHLTKTPKYCTCCFGLSESFNTSFGGPAPQGFHLSLLGIQTPRFRSHRIHHGSHRHGGIRHQGDRRPRATTTQSGLKVFEVLTQRSDLPQILICFTWNTSRPKNLGMS